MWFVAWIVFIGYVVRFSSAVGTYSVVAPRVLRPNRDFTVVLSTHGTQDVVRMTVEVGGRQDSGGEILNREVALVEPDSTQTLKFEIGELGSGYYNLTVKGFGGLDFENTTRLTYEGKSYSVFIETDRGVYKPGDTIKFRAVIVNPHLKPSVTGAIDVYVSDGKGNRVKQWQRVFTNKGVFSGKIELSDQPVLGLWNITVNVLGQKTMVSVLVAEYVLPKFEVEVELPDFATFDDEHIIATVKARYTHGRPVKGEVTVQVSPTYKYAYLQAPYDQPITAVKNIKGKSDFAFHIFDDLKLKEDYVRELKFTAYVKEELTERVQNTSSTVTIYKYPYKMQFIRTSDTFKPGLRYAAFLKLTFHDGNPIQGGSVTVRHAYSRDQSQFKEETHLVPLDGVVPLEFYPPLEENVFNLALEAKYKDLTQWLADLSRAQSPSDSFLKAYLLTKNPTVGEEVLIELNSTQPLVYFVYEILGRGDVIHAQTLQAHRGTTHEFRFVAVASMAPRARLIVYYIRNDGEIVADSLHFNVQGAIQNQIDLRISPESVDAGGEVTITVNTKPNSFVGITAIDKSSLLLRDRNSLSEEGILNELEQYDPGNTDSPSPWHYLATYRKKRSASGVSNDLKGQGAFSRKKRSLYSYHGTSTAEDVFRNSGVVILTNGMVYDYNPLIAGIIPPGYGPVAAPRSVIDRRPPAINGPFGRPFAPLDSNTVKPDLGPGIEYRSPIRPPLAGPYAFSFLPPPPDDKPRIYLSSELPPRWIFADAETRFNGVVTLREKAPDSMTSYTLTAFAIDDFYGLGCTERPTSLTVFRPFFVSLHLPSSIIRGEAVAVEMVIFNYSPRVVSANVTLYNPGPGDFLFPDFLNEIEQGAPAASRSKFIEVPANGGMPISFMIVPQKIGVLDIRVRAVSNVAVDSVLKKLLVKPEGTKLTVNKAFLVDLKNEQSFSDSVNVTTPPNIVNGSLSVTASVVGDILGPVVDNLDSLIQIPTGCGEQNMAKMIPNIVLIEYLKNKNQLTTAYLERAKRNLELGYQRQLTYMHEDGSFSAFGSKDKIGSTWLTAFVIKSFAMMRRHIDVEDAIINNATRWIVDIQKSDGSFNEVGQVNNVAMQGGASRDVPLTAYVTIALIKAQDAGINGLRNPINRALEYIVREMENLDNAYALSITTYVLELSKNAFKDSPFYKLEAKAMVGDEKKWWSDSELNKTIESTFDSKPLDVETTAYALLTYSLRNLIKDSLPILKWLTGQRNQNGGFQSTQDTAIGMEALAEMAKLMSTSNPRLEIQFISGSRGESVTVTNNNAMILQTKEITNDTKQILVNGRGSGFALVQITYSFNVDVTGPKPAFSLDPQVDANSDRNKLHLTTCTGYTGSNSSNMAVLDVSLPSGYVIDDELVPGLYKYRGVKRVDKKTDDSGVLLYFDSLESREVCPTVSAYRVAKVAFQKKVPVKVYDYYDLSRQARQFYSPSQATLCDICDMDECDKDLCATQIIELNKQRQDFADVYPGTVEEISGSVTPFSHTKIFVIFIFTFFILNY